MQARRITVLALLAGLTLAGCGEDEPEPKVEPPASSTAIPSPTAPVEPTLPPEAEGTSQAAAEAFVRHYYAMVDYSQATGSTDALRALAFEGCGPCAGGADTLDKIFERGGTIEGGLHTVKSAKSDRSAGNNPALPTNVEVRIATTAQRVAGSGTKWDGTVEPGEYTNLFVLYRQKDQWVVADWRTVS